MNGKRRAHTRGAGGAEDRPLDWPGDAEALTAEAVDFEALAHVLANTCRRGGRLKRFHSLAAHAVTMSEAIEGLGGSGGGHVRRLPAARPPHQATRSRPCGAALARSFPRPQETAGRGRERRPQETAGRGRERRSAPH